MLAEDTDVPCQPALGAAEARPGLLLGDAALAPWLTRAALAAGHPELAAAAAQHPDPWARASAAEDLGVLHGRQGGRERAIQHLKAALSGYRQAGAERDQARIRRRLPSRPWPGWSPRV